jgi:hypothetical protein
LQGINQPLGGLAVKPSTQEQPRYMTIQKQICKRKEQSELVEQIVHS